jgi:homogentisate phytyltransferase/homogentisate geranylgeranyltransferase
VVGTTLSIAALYSLSVSFSMHHEQRLVLLLLTIVGCLGANIYIVGLNQITDVEIDRINKPYLPLASGAFSMKLGVSIVSISLLLSLALSIYLGKYMLLAVLLSLCLGTAYSLPPFRLKRFHFWAAFCIIAVRGLVVNLLLFLHFHNSINGRENIPPVIWMLTAVIFVYSIVIAWFKDIPDMEGDRQFHIRTLSLRLGAENVFLAGNCLVSMVYIFLILFPFFHPFPLNPVLFASAHVLFLLALWIGVYRVKLADKQSMAKFYQFFWLLFFLEYVVFALLVY